MSEVKQIPSSILGKQTKEFLIKDTEVDLVHAMMWVKEFDPATGKPLFKPFQAKYAVTDWNKFEKRRRVIGGAGDMFKVYQLIHVPQGRSVLMPEVEVETEVEVKKTTRKVNKG